MPNREGLDRCEEAKGKRCLQRRGEATHGETTERALHARQRLGREAGRKDAGRDTRGVGRAQREIERERARKRDIPQYTLTTLRRECEREKERR